MLNKFTGRSNGLFAASYIFCSQKESEATAYFKEKSTGLKEVSIRAERIGYARRGFPTGFVSGGVTLKRVTQ
jgi:hypothetical protein